MAAIHRTSTFFLFLLPTLRSRDNNKSDRDWIPAGQREAEAEALVQFSVSLRQKSSLVSVDAVMSFTHFRQFVCQCVAVLSETLTVLLVHSLLQRTVAKPETTNRNMTDITCLKHM